jgi:hypothetical protein
MMMFDFLFYIYLILTIFYYFKRKELLSPGHIFFFFIIINIFLYLKGYSRYINLQNLDPSVYSLFIGMLFVFLLITVLTKKINVSVEDVSYQIKRPKLLFLLNLANISFVFVENIIGSGKLIPTLHNIDIHTFSMPIISLYTRSNGFLLIFNYLYYINSKKKRYILLSFLVALLPMVTRAARMTSVIAILQFLIFFIIINKKWIHNNFKQIAKIVSVSLILIIIMTSIAEYRMKNYNNFDETYSSTIEYTGYEDEFGILPMYYGYFVLGYENLNLSVKNIKSQGEIYTNGLYTFAPIFVGALKFDNLFNDFPDREYANSFRLNNVSSATVPTGFYEFFLDFGDYALFSVIIYGFITLFLYNRITKNTFSASYYSILAGAWALMSFQNVLIEVVTFYNLVFLFIFSKILLSKKPKGKIIKVY